MPQIRLLWIALSVCLIVLSLGTASRATISMNVAWAAYNFEPYSTPIGTSRGYEIIINPHDTWQAFAPQYTFTKGDVQPKLFSFHAHSSAGPVGAYARNYAFGDVGVHDQFSFSARRPELEGAEGTMRVTVFCNGDYTSHEDLSAPAPVDTITQWQLTAALGPVLLEQTGIAGPNGVSGRILNQPFTFDLPFVFDADEQTFTIHAQAYARSTVSAGATVGSVANLDLQVVWGGLQFFGPQGELLNTHKDIEFHAAGLYSDTTEAGFDWIAALPDPAGGGALSAAWLISIRPRRCRNSH